MQKIYSIFYIYIFLVLEFPGLIDTRNISDWIIKLTKAICHARKVSGVR